ncbi:MAG: hypothetical protein JW729_08010 [Bacteroidales bacterium]|nr:hypothetical protein [Bacteroidales bacterium]
MMLRKPIKYLIFLLLMFSLGASVSSCKVARMEKKAIREAERKQTKANNEFTKEYDKKYKHQTKIQPERQRKMIEKSRKKPKNMGKPQRRFFLFRWLGI